MSTGETQNNDAAAEVGNGQESPEVPVTTESPQRVDPAASSTDENAFSIEEVVPDHQAEPTAPAATSVESSSDAQAEKLSDNQVGEGVNFDQIKLTERNVYQEFPSRLEKSTGNPEQMALPSESLDVTGDIVDRAPQVDLNTPEDARWIEALTAGMKMSPKHVDGETPDPMTMALNRENADWRQAVMHEETRLSGSLAGGPIKGLSEVSGDIALMKLTTFIGAGGVFRAPMWHSGFWVSFRPANEPELIDLNQEMIANKIDMGRYSYGLSFSNETILSTQAVFECALRHVYQTSVNPTEMPIEKIRDILLPQDIPSFIWGFLVANNPNGFKHEQPCLNIGKCNHVEVDTLNVRKLQIVDNSRFTDWQRKHMASPQPGSRSLEQVKRYQDEMIALNKSRVVIDMGRGDGTGVAVTFKTPSVRDYFDQGFQWISSMVVSMEAAVGTEASPAVRNSMVENYTKAATLCQFAQWIEKIEYGDADVSKDDRNANIMTERKTILNSLTTLSSIDVVRESILVDVNKYISGVMVSLIGLPTYKCPICKTPSDPEETENGVLKNGPQKRSWIPIDILQVFTGLLIRRLSRIKER